MSMLSDDDKARLREEALFREELQRTLSEPKTENAFLKFLNSPFVVTLLGALIVAHLGHLWQEASLNRQKEISRLESTAQQRYDLLFSFVQNFESTMMILGSLRTHDIELRAAKVNRDADPKSEDAEIKFKSINNRYQDTWWQYQKASKINAFTIQIRARYSDPGVHAALKALDEAVVDFQGSGTNQEVSARLATVQDRFDELSKAMIAEAARNEF